jgi:2-methylcitrate dehydratase PrpD
MAAELAAAGLRGPRQALDGRFGFVKVFAGSTDSSRLTRGLGTAWEIEQTSVKLYACCRHFHAFIDALRECRQETAFRAEDVQAVEVASTAIALDGRMQYRPRSIMAAQYSLPYAVAATILLDPQDPRSFNEDAFAREEMVALMDRVSAHADPSLERHLPERFPGGVRVTLNDGQRIERTRLDSVGTPDYPVDRAGIVSKFRALMAGVASAEWQERFVDAVFSLEKSDGLARLTALLREVPNASAR